MARWIGIAGMVVGSIGIFFGFYYLSEAPQTSIRIVTATAVGVVGVLAAVRHVLFHRSDAARLGWETDRPDWIIEVGFANLAFGVMALLTVVADWGTQAQAVLLLGYSLYLFQAAMLHGYRYFTDERRSPARLWRSTIATLLYAGMTAFFGVHAACLKPGATHTNAARSARETQNGAATSRTMSIAERPDAVG